MTTPLFYRLALAFALVWSAQTCVAGQDSVPSLALRRAAEYLWQQQSDDGGWHSECYAVLRGGQALTPFALHALLQVPPDVYEPPQEAVDRALQFIRRSVDENGAIGLRDPDLLQYPNYSTAYAVQCLLVASAEADRPLIRRMAEYLIASQYNEAHGFDAAHVAYGGWGFAAPRRPGVADHMDLAHTRVVLQAIAAADASLDDFSVNPPVYERAECFLRLLQRRPDETRQHPIPFNWLGTQEAWHAGARHSFDGGFYFSPVVLAANKGGFAKDLPHWRSYATATCDGVLALLATGAAANDSRVQAAMEWLANHSDPDYPEGVPRDHPEPWGDSIRYYHYQARAAVLARLAPHAAAARAALVEAVEARQRPDGSFSNPSGHLMKEDDPLLCTALAALALADAALARDSRPPL